MASELRNRWVVPVEDKTLPEGEGNVVVSIADDLRVKVAGIVEIDHFTPRDACAIGLALQDAARVAGQERARRADLALARSGYAPPTTDEVLARMVEAHGDSATGEDARPPWERVRG